MAEKTLPTPGTACGTPTRLPSITGTILRCTGTRCAAGKSCKIYSRRKGDVRSAWHAEGGDTVTADDTKEYACFCA